MPNKLQEPENINNMNRIKHINPHFLLMRNKKLKSIISIFLSVLLLNLNLGCSYYTVVPIEITKENIQAFNKQDKYVIIHSEGFVYNMEQMMFNENGNSITGIAKHILPQHIYKDSRESKRVHRYVKKRQDPLSEVHFYVKNAGHPKMDTELTIPLDDVYSISINNRNTGRSVANAFMSSIGVFFAVILIVALTKSSCPFVYAKNGQEYSFVGELYPGTLTANMQRDDYLKLPKFDSGNNVYQLKITNELKEIQYTDLAQLILLEHNQDLEVLLDKNGNPHTFSDLIVPQKIRFDGQQQKNDVLQHKDNKYWSFNSAKNTPNSTREIVLDFDKPKNTKQAKLYLTAKNSVWLDVVFGKFNEQFGSYYNEFQRKQQNLDGEVSYRWINNQNIPLSVYIETNRGWELVDRISTVGPLAMRDLVIPMEIQNAGEGPLRVKLETGFMFWDVDFAAIDYSTNSLVHQQLIEPYMAVDQNNYEVTHLLQKLDQKYLVQAEIGDEVEITYELPKTKRNKHYSLYLKNRGYYNYIRDYEGTPDFGMLKSFREKNAFSKFSETSYLNFASQHNQVVSYGKE
nr:hypothetical protein [Allomuricauda sp.]